jgi:bacterioferritin-associated ferredoxin
LVVCICNAIREKELRETVRSGRVSNTCSAYAALGRKTRCGQCVPFAQSIIKSELATA